MRTQSTQSASFRSWSFWDAALLSSAGAAMPAFHEPSLNHLAGDLRIEGLPDVEKAKHSRQRDLDDLLNTSPYT